VNLNSLIKETDAFTIVDGRDVGRPKEISNMPKIRTQSELPLCYAFAAATIAQKKACDTDKVKFPDPAICSRMPPEQPEKQISPFSMVAWAKRSVVDGRVRDRVEFAPGSGSTALDNSQKAFSFMPESCLPFDKIVNTLPKKKTKMAK